MYSLYYLEQCPFCQKVIAFLKEKGIDIEMKEIINPSIKEDLMGKGGKTQVPFLYNEEKGIALYESEDIITHLSK